MKHHPSHIITTKTTAIGSKTKEYQDSADCLQLIDILNLFRVLVNRRSGSSSFAASPKVDLTTNSEEVTRITISQATNRRE